jgi:UTP--glucose-1-phosphate uridylyltransferase
MGNKLGIMKAQVEIALQHPEIGAEFRDYLKEISRTL